MFVDCENSGEERVNNCDFLICIACVVCVLINFVYFSSISFALFLFEIRKHILLNTHAHFTYGRTPAIDAATTKIAAPTKRVKEKPNSTRTIAYCL